MNDIRQSAEFSVFMQDIGWQTEILSGNLVYIRKFPIFGSFAKCPRPEKLIDLNELGEFLKKNKISRFKIAPFISTGNKIYKKYKEKLLDYGFTVDIEPFNPTTTITVDLTRKEDEIFKSFSEAKRRAVRRAIKNEITIENSLEFAEFTEIRGQQYSPLGFLLKPEMKALWKNFRPKHADLLLAKNKDQKPVGGILLLYFKQTAYYWYASALKEGKKLFAPTLLVYEAIKLAKKKGAKILDFEGIYDERFPKSSESWRGFTKFKEGFSEDKIIFMENFSYKRNIIKSIF